MSEHQLYKSNTHKLPESITMTSYLPAIQSIIPKWSSPTTATLPEIGSQAPAPIENLDLTHGTGKPTLVAFVRHCGCPFAEKEVKVLGQAVKENEGLHVVIVQHSEEKETREWFERIG